MVKVNTRWRVLLLCNYSPMYGGNFIPSLLALEKEIVSRGGECVYAFPVQAEKRSWFKQLMQMGKTVVTIDFLQTRYKQLCAISDIIKRYQITHIHSHFCSTLLLEIVAYLHPAVTVIIHLHSDWSLGTTSWKQKLKFFMLYKLLAARVRFLSVSSAFVAYNPAKITYVPNALVTERLPAVSVARAELRRRWGISESDVLCEIFAWSPLVKGLDIAAEAVKQVRAKGVAVKLAVVYGDAMPPEKLQTWLGAHTSCSGKEDFLLYVPPTEDVFSYHRAADILISASRSEGFPYSILEMLSLGKPCVMSNIPGVAWAKQFENTFVFPSENRVACAVALEKALAAPKMLEKTVQKIGATYNIANWVKTVVAHYEQ